MARLTAMSYASSAMDKLRKLALTAGRGIALLAAFALALVPALPAHAHVHEHDGIAAASSHHAHERAATEGSGTNRVANAAADSDGPATPQHAGDCCFVCHVSVIPAATALPQPVLVPRGLVRPPQRSAPPDVLAERLPEPPRPSA